MQNIESIRPWHPTLRPSLSSTQKQWLSRQGALTQALRTLGPLTLKVLAEYPAGACIDEANRLELCVKAPVWVREITISINGKYCVAARSVTPLGASHGVWQGMRRLRSRPLADILYDDATIMRSNFEVARLNKRTALYRTVQSIKTDFHPSQIPFTTTLLARRSVFWRKGSPLLVAECFLPEFWSLV
jgi:chorismate--pyruvate lyase